MIAAKAQGGRRWWHRFFRAPARKTERPPPPYTDDMKSLHPELHSDDLVCVSMCCWMCNTTANRDLRALPERDAQNVRKVLNGKALSSTYWTPLYCRKCSKHPGQSFSHCVVRVDGGAPYV